MRRRRYKITFALFRIKIHYWNSYNGRSCNIVYQYFKYKHWNGRRVHFNCCTSSSPRIVAILIVWNWAFSFDKLDPKKYRDLKRWWIGSLPKEPLNMIDWHALWDLTACRELKVGHRPSITMSNPAKCDATILLTNRREFPFFTFHFKCI